MSSTASQAGSNRPTRAFLSWRGAGAILRWASAAAVAAGLGSAGRGQPGPGDPTVTGEWYLTYHVTIQGRHDSRRSPRQVATIFRQATATIHYTSSVPGNLFPGHTIDVNDFLNGSTTRTWTAGLPMPVFDLSIHETVVGRGSQPVEGHERDRAYTTADSAGRGQAMMTGPPFLVVDTAKQRYWIGVPILNVPWQSLPLATQASERDVTFDGKVTTSGSSAQTFGRAVTLLPDPSGAPPQAWVVEEQLTDLQGSREFAAEWDAGMDDGVKPQVTVVLDWTLSPKPQNLEVIVSPVGYDQWLPAPGADEKTVGNTIEIRARLQAKGGGEPAENPQKFRFEIVDGSHEPGVCLNWPPASSAVADPDLKFEAGTSRLVSISADGQSGETPPANSPVGSAVVSCFDGGAYGWLKVTGIMADGTEVPGHLEGAPEKARVALPKRDDTTFIGDAWPHPKGLPDDDDSEDDPMGDGFDGDGLTLYEEYRGFREVAVGWPLNDASKNQVSYARANPEKKDVFISPSNQQLLVDIQNGVTIFKAATGLEVHSHVPPEALLDRQINFNHSGQAPFRTPQHALRVVADRELTDLEHAHVFGAGAMTFRLRGLLGPPREVKYIAIGVQVTPGTTPVKDFKDGGPRDFYDQCVAHELCHGCNIGHHGPANDPQKGDTSEVKWQRSDQMKPDPLGGSELALFETGSDRTTGQSVQRRIVVRTEAGAEIPATDPLFDQPRDVKLATVGGDHSGDENCLMRYFDANAVVAPDDPSVRYWIGENGEEPAGFQLCSSRQGTGVNAPASGPEHPRSRYGDAGYQPQGPGKGCKDQLRVNDAQ